MERVCNWISGAALLALILILILILILSKPSRTRPAEKLRTLPSESLTSTFRIICIICRLQNVTLQVFCPHL